jgi:phospholipid N-methyltransferase
MEAQGMKERLFFARMFLKRPRTLGSVVPSSRILARRVLEQVDWRARVIVEYGPGVGTVTEAVLRRMRPDAVLVAIESSPEFVVYLREQCRDPRLRVIEGSAADIAAILRDLSLPAADCIISSIPYSTMPAHTRERILGETHGALRPGGRFIVYQFTSAVLPHLRRFFGPVRQRFELWNIPPARIFRCSRAHVPATRS